MCSLKTKQIILLYFFVILLAKSTTTVAKRPSSNILQKILNRIQKFDSDDDCSCSSVKCGRDFKISRVVGGEVTQEETHPWAAAIILDKKFLCGATLINDRHVVTAAHCLFGHPIHKARVIIGTRNLTSTSRSSRLMKISRLWNHPQFNNNTFKNDIAIIQLETKVKFNRSIRPVCLPYSNDNEYEGKTAVVIGWGSTSEKNKDLMSPLLREISVPIISNSECRSKTNHKRKNIQDMMICAGARNGQVDACKGDSGGPMLIENINENGEIIYEIIGIVSWGIGCGRPRYPGVYTRVDRHLSFIYKEIGEECVCSSV